MPKGEQIVGFHQQPGRACFVDHLDQIRCRPVQRDSRLGQRELFAEQGGPAQEFGGLPGQESEVAGNRRERGVRNRVVQRWIRVRVAPGEDDRALSQQTVDGLLNVARVSARALDHRP